MTLTFEASKRSERWRREQESREADYCLLSNPRDPFGSQASQKVLQAYAVYLRRPSAPFTDTFCVIRLAIPAFVTIQTISVTDD